MIHIAIDGPAGAGKSTIAKILAKELNIDYLDTGAMYRAVTYYILSNDIDVNAIGKIIEESKKISIDFNNGKIMLNGIEVEEEIRSNQVNKNVSIISAIPQVREILVKKQQVIAKEKSVIMDGRDIATVVLPDANYKFYVDASIEERARRRFLELSDKGNNVEYEEIKKDIKNRDNMDTNRTIAPLKISKDAISIDSTDKSIEDVVSSIIDIINNKNGRVE